MFKGMTRSTVALTGLAALLLLGACSTTGDSAVKDDQAEVRPFTEDGYDPTQSAPETADVNNDGHVDSSTLTPRNESVVGVTTVTNNPGQSTVTVTQTGTATTGTATDSSTTGTMTSGTSVSGTSTTDTTVVDDSDRFSTGTSGTTTTTTQSTTTVPMTSSADDDDDDDTTPARERLRKD